MNLCSTKHTEVCYEDYNSCPVCELMDQVKELEGVIENLNEEIKDLQSQ